MKILFIQPTSDKRGHYGLWTNQMCQALSKHHHSVVLFTNKNDPKQFLNEPPLFQVIEAENGRYAFTPYDEIKKEKPWLYWWGYFKTSFLMVRAALKWCRHNPCDAIFLTDTEYLMAALLLKWYGRKSLPPVVWHVQAANFTYDSYSGSMAKKLYKVFQRGIFKTVIGDEVKGFAVLGKFHQDELRKQLKIASSFPIEIVPDGADVPEISVSRSEAQKKIGISDANCVFLFLGMLRKDKGLEYLIEAVSHLKDKDIKVVIAGAPFEWTKEAVQALIDQHGVNDKIIFRPDYIADADVPFYYYACDAVLFPYTTIYTGGCGPLIKGASAHGKPVIVTNVSDLGRVVSLHGNGLVSAPCDASAYAKAMLDFISGDQQKMIHHANELAKKHAWANVSETLSRLLDGAGGTHAR